MWPTFCLPFSGVLFYTTEQAAFCKPRIWTSGEFVTGIKLDIGHKQKVRANVLSACAGDCICHMLSVQCICPNEYATSGVARPCVQHMGRSRCKEVSSTNPAAISITLEELYGRLGVIVLQENTFVPCAEPAAPPRPLLAFLLVCRPVQPCCAYLQEILTKNVCCCFRRFTNLCDSLRSKYWFFPSPPKLLNNI